MDIKKFIENFYNQFDDTDFSEFSATTKFRELYEWSSLTQLAVFNMIDRKYGKTLRFEDLYTADTIQDLYNLVILKT